MKHIIYSDKCTGCSACLCICPQKCISMTISEDGFLYPSIQEGKCVECGLCTKVCPIENHELHKGYKKTVGFYSSDAIRRESTSGGFFTELSDYVLNNNGVIYGAAYDQNFRVNHIRGKTFSDRNKMRTSKYVQSTVGHIFEDVALDLINNTMTLFSGTPCQVVGLYNYLNLKKIPVENLITCDLICHGVPSPLIWEKYLSFLENKYKDKIQFINFRDKKLGWHKPRLKIDFVNSSQELTENQDPFYNMFYSNCILRLSCHTCEYAKKDRVSDFTMADCWGIEKVAAQKDDNKGISLILINSDKAINLFEQILVDRDNAYFDVDVNLLRQPHLKNPAPKSVKREKFWHEYSSKGYYYVMNKYGYYSWYMKILRIIKKYVSRVIRR